jgi:hypothetical protein
MLLAKRRHGFFYENYRRLPSSYFSYVENESSRDYEKCGIYLIIQWYRCFLKTIFSLGMVDRTLL